MWIIDVDVITYVVNNADNGVFAKSMSSLELKLEFLLNGFKFQDDISGSICKMLSVEFLKLAFVGCQREVVDFNLRQRASRNASESRADDPCHDHNGHFKH